VITLELARRLHASGVPWTPAVGDRFVVPDRDMDSDVFVISDMVVEVREVPSGRILAFNGTTEWALDSVDASTVVWLPREEQLRELLGPAFVSFELLDGVSVEETSDAALGYAVTIQVAGERQRHIDVDAEAAYARALLALGPQPSEDG
jgi:hypothetical protein